MERGGSSGCPTNYRFIPYERTQTPNSGLGKSSRKTIRAHAMRHVRQRQRLERDRRLSGGTAVVYAKGPSHRPAGEENGNDSVLLNTTLSTCVESPAIIQTRSESRPHFDESVVMKADESISGFQQLEPAILKINPWRIYRTGIIERKLQDWFGNGDPLNRTVERNSFNWSSPSRSRAEESVSIAVCLFHLAAKTKDKDVLVSARRYYAAGVNLAKGSESRVNFNSAMNTASKLYICDIFGISSPLTTELILDGHVKGIANIIRSAVVAGATDNLNIFQVRKFRFKTIMRSLVYRRPIVDKNIWSMCSPPRSPDTAEELIQLAIRLVLLLDETYAPVSSRIVEAAHTIQEQLVQLREELENWSLLFYQETCADCMQDPRSSNAAMPDRSALTTEKLRAITSSFCRGSLLRLCYFCFHVICTIVVETAVLDITATDFWTVEAQTTAKERLEAQVEVLCNVIDYRLSSPADPISNALLLRAPIHFAQDCCKRMGQASRLVWLEEQENIVRGAALYFDWTAVLFFSFHQISWFEQHPELIWRTAANTDSSHL